MPTDWEQGVCSCFNDCTMCITVYLVPCYVIGKNAEAVGDSCFWCGLCHFHPHRYWFRTHIRGKIREQKGIRGSCIADCCLVFWCYRCTICQEAQEVKSLGDKTMARK